MILDIFLYEKMWMDLKAIIEFLNALNHRKHNEFYFTFNTHHYVIITFDLKKAAPCNSIKYS